MSVLVFTENWDGRFKKLSFELVSYAVKVAEMTGTEAIALSLGKIEPDELMKLGNYGVRRILNVISEGLTVHDSQTYAEVISNIAAKEKANIVLFSNNNMGKALAPRVAVRLHAGLGAGISKLPVSFDPFCVYRKVYSGNAFAQVKIKSDIKVLTLAQNSYQLNETANQASIENVTPEFNPQNIKTKIVDIQKQTGKILLTDAEIVVSGGRGMKSPDNWGPLVELASLLGAATACSRPVSDEGWRPSEEHTGQTGKIISPNLYIAIGISGATQHLAGVSSSKYIVAINTDKDAPIFEAAQYGIIGDAAKVLPKMVEAVREIKAK
ncbi:MAG: electron transfer flavoprotein subunit alpha/FixB family protein [Bacteroidota bacterium]|nr:electron transfer flavoprotein subunit alpha/FixB family protein [Bacteroidota bacterium]